MQAKRCASYKFRNAAPPLNRRQRHLPRVYLAIYNRLSVVETCQRSRALSRSVMSAEIQRRRVFESDAATVAPK